MYCRVCWCFLGIGCGVDVCYSGMMLQKVASLLGCGGYWMWVVLTINGFYVKVVVEFRLEPSLVGLDEFEVGKV